MIDPDDREPIHTWFSLSYSSHLVLDPALTRRLPEQQQHELNTMLDQLNRSFPDVNPGGDTTLALAAVDYECSELNEDQLVLVDMSVGDEDEDHDDCEHSDDEDENWWCERENRHWYDWRGDQCDADDRIAVPTETVEQARAAGRTVVSRTLLQSMPTEWQHRFVELLQRLDLAGAATPETYDIRFYTADGHRTTDPIPHYRRGRTRLVPTVVAG